MLLIKLSIFWCINSIFTAFVFVEASKDSDSCLTKKLYPNFMKDLVQSCLQDFNKCQEGLQSKNKFYFLNDDINNLQISI